MGLFCQMVPTCREQNYLKFKIPKHDFSITFKLQQVDLNDVCVLPTPIPFFCTSLLPFGHSTEAAPKNTSFLGMRKFMEAWNAAGISLIYFLFLIISCPL